MDGDVMLGETPVGCSRGLPEGVIPLLSTLHKELLLLGRDHFDTIFICDAVSSRITVLSSMTVFSSDKKLESGTPASSGVPCRRVGEYACGDRGGMSRRVFAVFGRVGTTRTGTVLACDPDRGLGSKHADLLLLETAGGFGSRGARRLGDAFCADFTCLVGSIMPFKQGMFSSFCSRWCRLASAVETVLPIAPSSLLLDDLSK